MMTLHDTLKESIRQLNDLPPSEILSACAEYADVIYEVYEDHFAKVVRFEIAENLRQLCVEARK